MLFMVIITLILFIVIWVLTNIWIGLIISPLFFFAWMQFNHRASTRGLVRANLREYFKAISSGDSEDEALMFVLTTRYPFDQARRDMIWQAYIEVKSSLKTQERVWFIINMIFVSEVGIADRHISSTLQREFNNYYLEKLLELKKIQSAP